MVVTFLSIDEENNIIKFKSDVSYIEENLSFLDKSCDNTTILLTLKDNYVKLTRHGDITMQMDFKLGKSTKGFYQNAMGLSFEFDIFCSLLSIKEHKIDIQYKMILEDGTTNKQTLKFIFTEE